MGNGELSVRMVLVWKKALLFVSSLAGMLQSDTEKLGILGMFYYTSKSMQGTYLTSPG